MGRGSVRGMAGARASVAVRPTRVAVIALIGVLVILGLKVGLFVWTGSAAVLSDAMESVVNVAAAMMALFSVWYAGRPADREHPYGHGKVEFITAGIEGLAVLGAGALIAIEAVERLVRPEAVRAAGAGMIGLIGVAALLAGLAWYILRAGRRLQSPALIADGRHLMVDVVSTVGVAGALGLVKLTGWHRIDPIAAGLVCVLVIRTGVGLMRHAWGGLLDRIDEADDAAIRQVLDEEVVESRLVSYEKVRHRHQGAFHWVDMHLRFPPRMSVAEAHDEASRIEKRVEKAVDGEAKATAHIEPGDDAGADERGER